MSCHNNVSRWAAAVEGLAEDALAGQSEGEIDVYPRLRAMEAEARALAAEMRLAVDPEVGQIVAELRLREAGIEPAVLIQTGTMKRSRLWPTT